MVKFKINEGKIEITCLTNSNEITPDALTKLTEHVKLAPNFSAICLCWRVPIRELALSVSAKKDIQKEVGVTTYFAKASDGYSGSAAIGDKLIVDRSTLERGHQLNINSGASKNFIFNLVDTDDKLRKELMAGEILDTNNCKVDYLCVLEFKIVPTVSIVAAIPSKCIVNDPFKTVIKGA